MSELFPKVKRETLAVGQQYRFTSPEVPGITWTATKTPTVKFRYHPSYYKIEGDGWDEYYATYPVIPEWIATLDDVKDHFEKWLAHKRKALVEARYPGLVSAYADAHNESDLGYGDEGAGYDNHFALKEFMESDAMKAYLTNLMRWAALDAADLAQRYMYRGEQNFKVKDEIKERYK